LKKVRINARLLKLIRSLATPERREVGRRIAEAQRCIGQPHLHKGIGLRKLQDDFLEIRVGLKQRLVFENTDEALVFEILGDHDDVKNFLKAR
jgi:hypothetical protein